MSLIPGALKLKDPSATKSGQFDWSSLLTAGVEIATPTITTSGPSVWTASTAYREGAWAIPTIVNGHEYRCTEDGTSGSSEPVWPTISGATVVDGTAVWTELGTAVLVDNVALVTGNRKVNYRVSGGVLGSRYTITNHIVTNESPIQTDERSIDVLIQNL